MVSRAYIPERGDIIWLEFDPQAGREQAGRRPALVLSPKPYNQLVSLALCCPITSQVKGYPFEVLVTTGKIKGAVLSDHLKSLDWRARKATFIARASSAVLDEVMAKLGTILA